MKAPILLLLTLLAFNGIASPSRQATSIKESDFDKVIITFERSECFGSCPVYSISIYGDGTVIYNGKKYVRVKGKRKYKIPKEDVKKLVDEFYRIDFFSLKDEYTHIVNADGSITDVSDLPGKTTSIKIGGKTKSVYNYFGGPDSLKELEHKIDEVSRSAKYVRRD